uniref:Tripartite motif containing 10 n=1 Tax=Terrapene triunguis TaxID=2587831 RepID=A0A674JAU9_9SAUR
NNSNILFKIKISFFLEAVICSICLDYFNDPVILKCGHNFCRVCITQYCKDSKISPFYSCPQCREWFRKGEFHPNWQLRNVVDIAKKIPEPRGKKACEKHVELLKLFCEVDQTPICLVCRESRSHKEHSVVPIEEAALDYQVIISHFCIWNATQPRHKQLQTEKQIIVSEFQQLRQFLVEQERLLLAQLEKLNQEIEKRRDESQRCSPGRAGEILEAGGCLIHSPAGAGSVTDTIRPCPRAELCPSRSDSLSAANVTLDPDVAHPELIVSADQKSVRWGPTHQALPDNPERFDTVHCVLGCEGFTSGRHYWEVEVEMEDWGLWAVGVARESVSRKGGISFIPEQGIWAVRCSEDQYRALTSPEQRITPLSLSRAPRRIRVYLDYEEGQVALFDAGHGDPIFTFPPASFAGERIRPLFWVGRGGSSSMLLHHFSLLGQRCQLTLCP